MHRLNYLLFHANYLIVEEYQVGQQVMLELPAAHFCRLFLSVCR